MSFQGSLATIGIREVFQLFESMRKTGALHISADSGNGVIYFDSGDVYYATAAPLEGIGNMLVNAGVATLDQWKDVLSSAESGQCQIAALIALDGVDADAVERFMRERVDNSVFQMLQWRGGFFELRSEAHPVGAAFHFVPTEALDEGERRLAAWDEIRSVIPSLDAGISSVGQLDDGQEAVTVDPDEWRAIASMMRTVTVGELSAALGQTEYSTSKLLQRLLGRNLIRMISAELLTAERRSSDTDDMSRIAIRDVGDSTASPPEATSEAALAETSDNTETSELDDFDDVVEPAEPELAGVSLVELAARAGEGDEYADEDRLVDAAAADEYGVTSGGASYTYVAESSDAAPSDYGEPESYREAASGYDTHPSVTEYSAASLGTHGSSDDDEVGDASEDEGATVPEADLDKSTILRLIAGVRSL